MRTGVMCPKGIICQLLNIYRWQSRRSFVSLNGVNFVPLLKSLVKSHFEIPHVYGHHMKKSGWKNAEKSH